MDVTLHNSPSDKTLKVYLRSEDHSTYISGNTGPVNLLGEVNGV